MWYMHVRYDIFLSIFVVLMIETMTWNVLTNVPLYGYISRWYKSCLFYLFHLFSTDPLPFSMLGMKKKVMNFASLEQPDHESL